MFCYMFYYMVYYMFYYVMTLQTIIKTNAIVK